MPANTSVVADWMLRIASKIGSDFQLEHYRFEVSTGKRPVVHVRLIGAAEDTTAARIGRTKLEAIVGPLVLQGLLGVDGFTCTVRSYNHGDDLLLECEVLFP